MPFSSSSRDKLRAERFTALYKDRPTSHPGDLGTAIIPTVNLEFTVGSVSRGVLVCKMGRSYKAGSGQRSLNCAPVQGFQAIRAEQLPALLFRP